MHWMDLNLYGEEHTPAPLERGAFYRSSARFAAKFVIFEL